MYVGWLHVNHYLYRNLYSILKSISKCSDKKNDNMEYLEEMKCQQVMMPLFMYESEHQNLKNKLWEEIISVPIWLNQ